MSTLSTLYNNIVTLMNQTFSKKTDVDSSISSHNTNSSAHSTEMAKKVNVNQGNSNASKNVVTDSSGNITVEAKPTIPSKTSDLTNDSGFLTSHQDISGKANISDLATVATSGSYNDLSDKPAGLTVDSSLSSTSTNPVQNKVINTALNGKASSSHNHTKSEITDFPSTMTPSSHSHGSVTNDGKIGSASGKIITTGTNGVLQASDSITKSMISDFPSSMTPTSHTHNTGEVSDTSAYSNIGSSANATQKTINDKINTALGNKANSSNVYTKSETYTQAEITTAIGNAVGNLTLFEIVTELPTTNIKNNRLYLVANNKSIESNTYDIYLRVNNTWEQLDSLEFDIANYYNKTETDTLLSGKVDTSDSRLTDSRTPKSHAHGNITNTGAIGSTANLPVITTTSGKLTTGSFGSAANTFCQGNDSRLSDARTPTSHTHGSITNDGKIGTASGKIITTGTSGVLQASDSITKSMISDFPTSMTPTSHTHTKSEISDFPSTMTPSSHTHGNLQNDGTVKVSNTVQKSKNLVTDANGYLNVEDKITKTSQLTNDSGFLTSHQDISGKANTSHTHGNITSDGKIGTTATLPIITGTGGVLQAGSFGNSAGTFCQGNDSRLSNSRTPTSHASTATTYGVGTTANYGHVKTINGLTQSSHTDGTALSAYQGKVLKDLVDGKASSTHSHTVSNITDFPSIPSKTSDLTNDSGFLTSHQDISGKIDTAGTGLSKSGTTLNHSNSITAVTTAAFKKIKYDAQGHITGTSDVTSSDLPSHTHAASGVTDANANNYTNIGSLSSGATQQAINAAINTKIASLTNIDLVNLVTSLPTASASTMNQLYVVAKTGGSGQDTYNIYVTVKSGSTYKWEKIDDFDLQTLSIAWNSVTGKPTFANVATSGSYNDLTDTPTIPTNNNQLTNGAGYITSSAISGKIDTAGTGLSKSGTTLNHSNSITAVTTAAFKKIKYDAQGHITGTADVTASDLPSHTHSDYNKATYSQTVASTATGAYEIGKITVDGTATTIYGKDTDTVYSHPTYTSKTSGLYKITVDGTGHVSAATAVQKSDITGLGIPSSDTTYSAEKGISLSSGKFGHSNTAITALTTSALKKIKYDAYGHITGTDDVAASDLPSHTHSQYALSTDIPTTTSNLTNDGEDGENPFVTDDDSRLSDARTPTSHTHGNLTNDGKVGSTANYFVYTTTGGAITSKQKIGNITTSGAIGSTSGLPLKTTTSGVITTGSFGTTSGTFCQGNDSRLHTHTFTYSNGSLTIT